VAKCVDERLIGHATDEGIDDVDIGDVGELVVLLGEMLDMYSRRVSSDLCL
jgi:hypothetical protein